MAKLLTSALLLGLCLAAQVLAQKPVTLDTTYNVFIRVGQKYDGLNGQKNALGDLYNKYGKPMLSSSGNVRTADNSDFTSYLTRAGKIYQVNQQESSPAGYTVTRLAQDAFGHLAVETVDPVDYSAWGGSIRPCAGSVSPWNTHIGAEETYQNIRLMENALAAGTVSGDVTALMEWNGYYRGTSASLKAAVEAQGGIFYNSASAADTAAYVQKALETIQPYMIGHVFEIDIDNEGRSTFKKHLALGRSNFETAYIMPDLKTVYLTDDAGNRGGLMKFICDVKGDLSKGTLYAAKVTQTNPDNSPAAELDVAWIELGYIDHDLVLEQASKPIGQFKFSDIYEYGGNAVAVNGKATCPDGFRPVAWDSTPTECLKLKDGMNMYAAALETRRHISYMHATSEFSKMEGFGYDPAKNVAYFAISTQRNGMSTNSATWDFGTSDDIRVTRNECGCTYAGIMDSTYNMVRIVPEVCGIETFDDDVCSYDKPANPDNISHTRKNWPWIIISEDSGFRNHDLLWAHNTDTKESIIIGKAEGGAEVCAGWFYTFGQYSYVFATYQGSGLPAPKRSPIGYLGPWKIPFGRGVTFVPVDPAERTAADGNLYERDAPFVNTTGRAHVDRRMML